MDSKGSVSIMKTLYYLPIIGGLFYIMRESSTVSPYDELINAISIKYGNPPELVKAIIKVESNFNPNAHNTDGENSRGLGQINEVTAKALGVVNMEKLFEPEYNIEIINKLINHLRTIYSAWKDIISAYNAGRVNFKDGKYSNQKYVDKVYKYYTAYS